MIRIISIILILFFPYILAGQDGKPQKVKIIRQTTTSPVKQDTGKAVQVKKRVEQKPQATKATPVKPKSAVTTKNTAPVTPKPASDIAPTQITRQPAVIDDAPVTPTKTTTPTAVAPKNNLTPAPISQVPATGPKLPPVDTIYKMGGKKLGVNVQKINATSVSYSKLGSSEIIEMPRKDIEKVMFRDGRREVFNKPVVMVLDQTNWEAVLVTEKKEDVEGLYMHGYIKTSAAAGSMNTKAAKSSATIRLQKKAANMNSLIVLLTSSEMKGGYGESPGWDLEGIAYSDSPPADTGAVNKNIRRILQKKQERDAKAKKKKE